jgi:hypothetical protein
MVKYLRFLIGDPANPRYETVLQRRSLDEMWTGLVPIDNAGQPDTAYTAGPDAKPVKMGLGFFVSRSQGSPYVFHDGDQGGFSSELVVDPVGHSAAILAVNTTDTGVPPPNTLHAMSNTEPDPHTDLRLALRRVLIETVFPAYRKPAADAH